MKKIVLLFIVSTMIMTGLASEDESQYQEETQKESESDKVTKAAIEAVENRFYAKYVERTKEKETTTEMQTEPATEMQTEPPTEIQTETVTEMQTEPVTEMQTEPPTEPQTEPVTEAESVTEVQTEPITEPQYITSGAGISLSDEDYNQLLKIVEAEAGNQDEIGKMLVANVIFNRVKNSQFPNTVTEVIYQNGNGVYQFEPVLNGRIYEVQVSDSTVNCVDRAIAGEDYSQGALFFTMRTSPDSWFNTSLRLLFVHGDHYFYTC